MAGLKIVIAIFISTIVVPSNAQIKNAPTDSVFDISKHFEKLNKNFIKEGFKDAFYTVSRPVHWQQKDWVRFSALAGATGATMLLDNQIKNLAQHNQNNFTNSIANTAETVGNIYGIMVFPVIYATGIIIKNPRVETIGLRGGKAMFISTGITYLAKNIIRRQRPDAATNPYNFALPFTKTKYTSIPSAHTSIAFTMATVLAEEFPHKKWVAPVAYSIASLTAASRIYQNRHWASDVVLGAALGYFATRAVYAIEHKKKHKPTVQ